MTFCPVHCSVVPPRILEALARRGRESQAARALDTLKWDRLQRSRRRELHRMRAPYQALLRARELRQAWWPAVTPCAEKRSIYDAQTSQQLPGRLVRSEGDKATGGKDKAADEAYDGLGATFELFLDEYQRCSIDNQGMELIGTVHYGKDYENAFWNGDQMVFGDGDEGLPPDQRIFNRFTVAVDVIGHELTHGVTDRTAGLVYWGQPGALNVSISDAFGSMVEP